jgi:superoxide reductase
MRRTGMVMLIAVLGTFIWSAAQASGPFSEIKKGQDPKHTPVIDAPETVKAGESFKVTVKVGKTMHPSDVGHSIHWIELYAGEVELARASFTPTVTLPVVTFTIVLDESTTLRALSQPNHSAAWESTKKITVTKK